MVTVEIKYWFLRFLYAYMHQIDLSVDRSRWGPWDALKEYYKFQISPLKVSDHLLAMSKLQLPPVPLVYAFERPSLWSTMKSQISRVVAKKSYLEGKDVILCCQMLHDFHQLLNSKFDKYPLEAEKMRISVARFCSAKLAPKLARKDYQTALRVEHFMQYDDLSVVKIDLFIDGIL